MPDENFTSASPRLIIAWPGRGRTYVHPPSQSFTSVFEGGGVVDVGGVGAIESGSRTCSPPSLLNSTVTLPKSVCSPNATPFTLTSCGGALTKRLWSPEFVLSWCRASNPRFARSCAVRGSRDDSRDVMSMQIACEERIYDS